MMWLQWWKTSILMVCNILWAFTHTYVATKMIVYFYKLQYIATMLSEYTILVEHISGLHSLMLITCIFGSILVDMAVLL